MGTLNGCTIIGTGQSLSLHVNAVYQLNLLTSNNFQWGFFGKGGASYNEIKKGTSYYDNSILSGGVLVDLIHGETDTNLGTSQPQYLANILQMQKDYSADLGINIPLVTDQMSSLGNKFNRALMSPIALSQWQASQEENIYLVGPKYQYPYVDGIHLTEDGYKWLSDQHGKVISKILTSGNWQPFEPIYTHIQGDQVIIYFNVPKLPIQIDVITRPYKNNFGFEFEDQSGTSIKHIDIDEDKIILQLTGIPSGKCKVKYAHTGDMSLGSRFGNIKDSDDTQSYYGFNLSNWLIQFEIKVYANKN